MKNALLFLVLGLVGPDGSTNPDRFVIQEGTLAISRPDETWKFEVDASDPPTVAKMTSSDGAALVDVQVQRIPGVTLAQVKAPIEQALAAQGRGFRKLSGSDVEVHGVPAYDLAFTLTVDGVPRRARLLVSKPGDTLYVVNCRSSVEEWHRFEDPCDTVLAGFELVSKKPWGRRILWAAEAGPEAREHASFVLDPERDRAVMLLGSGYRPYLDPLDDAWAYDLSADRWAKLELEGDAITPGGSRRVAPVRGGAFIHGGYGKELSASRDLWRLRFGDTRIEATLVEQKNAPEPRSLHGFAADTRGERFVVFGGGTTSGVLGDTWVGTRGAEGVTWRELNLDDSPGPRYGFSFAHDEEKGLLIVCGGQIPSKGGVAAFASDVWALNFTADDPKWTLLARYDPQEFPGRRNPAFAFEQRSGALFVWGGAGAGGGLIPDLFIVRTREEGAPLQTVPQSPLVPTRASGFGVVDPTRSRVLLGFGNIEGGPFLDLVEVGLER